MNEAASAGEAGPGQNFLHASAVVVGEAGVLILGPSGSGKSSLALALIEAAHSAGLFSRLVGDDRINITRYGPCLIARGHPLIRGQIEARGLGILSVASLDAAVVGLAIDLSCDEMPLRLPDKHASGVMIADVRLPCLRPPSGLAFCDLAASVLRHLRLPRISP